MTTGLLISEISAGSQASGKLQPGDEIVTCNGWDIETLDSLKQAMSEGASRGSSTIEIVRSGERKEFSFAPGPLGITFDTGDESGGQTTGVASSGGAVRKNGVAHPESTHVNSGQYDVARAVAKIVGIVGWVFVAIGGLVLLSAFGQQGFQATMVAVAGAVVAFQGLVVVLVSYGLLGVVDTADNTRETVFLLRRLKLMLEKT